MLSAWPQAEERYDFPEEEQAMEGVMDLIRAIRAIRQDLKVQPGHKARVLVRPQEGWETPLAEAETSFQRLAGASSLTLLKPGETVQGKTVSAVCRAGEALLPLGELVDMDREIARLEKEAQAMRDEIARGEGKLKNEGFLKKAPPQLVEAEQDRLSQNRAMLLNLTTRLLDLTSE